MSVFSGLNKLKDALDDAISDDRKQTPAGHSKTQDEVRSEIHGEERKERETQKKSGWSDRVSFENSALSAQSLNVDLDAIFENVALRSRMSSMAMMKNVGSKTSS